MAEYNVEKDGTLVMKEGESVVRYVKESDLLAIKGANGTKLKEFEAQVEGLTRERDTKHQAWLQEQAAHAKTAEQVKEFDALKVKAGEWEVKATTESTERAKLEEELTGMKRSQFITFYHAPEDKVKSMTLTQLREAEGTLALLGTKPGSKPANFDGGAGGSHTPPAMTAQEAAIAEIKAARDRAKTR